MPQHILDALIRRKAAGIYPMHVPGHKQGRGISESVSSLVRENLFGIDMTEVPGLDDLYDPKGCIRESEVAAARLFGADKTFFLVNGSTVGVLAAILAVCGEGGKLMVPNSIHQSVVSGMVISGADPVLVPTVLSTDFAIPLGVSRSQLESALLSEGRVSAVLLSNPSYYGVCQDLESLVSACHDAGAVVIVDEAHGSHLSFCGALPIGALDSGADIVIQSTHKTLGSLTQTSLLHLKGPRVNEERVASCLRMLQTSSPSYPLMASLEAMVARMEVEGTSLVSASVENSRLLRDRLSRLPGLTVLDTESISPDSCDAPISATDFSIDPTRLVVNGADLGLGGSALAESLRRRGFEMEFSDLLNAVGVITYADSCEDLTRLSDTLASICEAAGHPQAGGGSLPHINRRTGELLRRKAFDLISRTIRGVVERQMSVRQAVLSQHRQVPLSSAIGKISGDVLAPYPPGVVLVFPGQTITEEAVSLIREQLANGGSVHGVHRNEDGCLTCSVVSE